MKPFQILINGTLAGVVKADNEQSAKEKSIFLFDVLNEIVTVVPVI